MSDEIRGKFTGNYRESEIEEDEWSKSEELFEIKHLDSITEEIKKEDEEEEEEDVVYVGVLGNMSSNIHEDSNMDALVWTLNHAVIISPSSSLIYLIHVFPQLHHIPTPLGKLPISQVNPEQKEKYLIQERGKRRDSLQKFLDICSVSKVNVETILIESDMEAKAILDLIPILNIKKLILGTPKSTTRKLRSKKGNETIDKILQGVPDFCELHIISEGKQVLFEDKTIDSSSPRAQNNINIVENNNNNNVSNISMEDQIQNNSPFPCSCFKPKALA